MLSPVYGVTQLILYVRSYSEFIMSETKNESSADYENVPTQKRRWIMKGLDAAEGKRYPLDPINNNDDTTS